MTDGAEENRNPRQNPPHTQNLKALEKLRQATAAPGNLETDRRLPFLAASCEKATVKQVANQRPKLYFSAHIGK
ncbi:uncharacterized protein LAJ45_09416 [Morchella importuna]|uniref:uncharacterized protein n=1 Tax=Morchella importuna TaxID=1174673 RepID=UPI001E8CED36|nr:uncharacterized protein LAJ45_09416 [Morchella importuna]KAH8146470.1 hypothetical protein LAJ45_09416 [Morchella importuna]